MGYADTSNFTTAGWTCLSPLRAAWCAVIVALVWLPQGRAELSWPQKTVELNANGQAAVLEARFAFVNDGETPVNIVQVQTSCGCTTVALAQRHFEPGEKGEIVARYDVGSQVGLQKKTIVVSTAADPAGTVLTLIVHIPELVRLQPGFITWEHGEPGVEKTITLEATDLEKQRLTDVSVASSNAEMVATAEPVREGREYKIGVTPGATGQSVFATLTIHCHLGAENKVFHAYASVLPAVPVARGAQTAGSLAAPGARPSGPAGAKE